MTGPDASRMKADLARLVSFKTENPPGREVEAARFLSDLFRKDGFSTQIDQYKPGRANIIAKLEQEEIARLGKTIPVFAPGDTVIVNVSVVEGERKRIQAYEGVVIAKRNRGLNSSFVVRKISSGEGVERTFQTYSPLIASIDVKRKGDVRRAKLYYLRDRSGKSARIREKLAHVHREKQDKQPQT